jgi:hypothetical protein
MINRGDHDVPEYDTTTLLVIDAILAVIPGYIGWRKGYSFFVGWLGSFFTSPLIAIPVLLFAYRRQEVLDKRRMRDRNEIKCPSCQEFVSANAIVCPHCRRDIQLPMPSSMLDLPNGAVNLDPAAKSAKPEDFDFSAVVSSKRSTLAYQRTVRWVRVHAWFWFAAIGMLIVGFAASTISSFNDLKVEATGPVLAIQNAGHSPIRILQIVINDRTDCAPWVDTSTGHKFQPADLKVGDATIWLSSCPIVRVEIKTSEGSYTYNF